MAMSERDVIFEFQRHGAQVKVSAVDAATGTEVSIIGPALASPESLKQTALRKLDYVLAKAGQAGKPSLR